AAGRCCCGDRCLDRGCRISGPRRVSAARIGAVADVDTGDRCRRRVQVVQVTGQPGRHSGDLPGRREGENHQLRQPFPEPRSKARIAFTICRPPSRSEPAVTETLMLYVAPPDRPDSIASVWLLL